MVDDERERQLDERQPRLAGELGELLHNLELLLIRGAVHVVAGAPTARWRAGGRRAGGARTLPPTPRRPCGPTRTQAAGYPSRPAWPATT
jgi:hypothetical protein